MASGWMLVFALLSDLPAALVNPPKKE